MSPELESMVIESGMACDGTVFDQFDDDAIVRFSELVIAKYRERNKMLSYELLGVIIDVEEGDGFDDVCLTTIKRVARELTRKI